MNYLKYAVFLIGISSLFVIIGYIVTNERKVANLKLENQAVTISSETLASDLKIQKNITTSFEKKINNENAINKKIIYKKVNKEFSIEEINDIINCELKNFNNIDILCQK